MADAPAAGSGSDLTHHLILVDYIERHGQLPHDASAVEYLGEIAHYTPGLHLLAVIAGTIARTDGFHALYPVVACAVALKYAIFFLVLLRLLADSPIRLPLSAAGTIAVLTASTYTLGSFVEDSFLAQAVSELFAVAAWWALVWWDSNPSRLAMGLFAVAGIAIFLTGPSWPASRRLRCCCSQRALPAPATARARTDRTGPHRHRRARPRSGVPASGHRCTSGAVVPPSVPFWVGRFRSCRCVVRSSRPCAGVNEQPWRSPSGLRRRQQDSGLSPRAGRRTWPSR
jgi:hypothetical protein